MNGQDSGRTRCGFDTVEIKRVERMLEDRTPEELSSLFSTEELDAAGAGPGRAASLAARFAAKEACCKLFPRETALGAISLSDFSVARDQYGAPSIRTSGNAQAVLDRHRVGVIRVSLTHTQTSASAMALADPRPTDVPWFGRWLYHLFPYRRKIVLGNLRRVFGDVVNDGEIVKLAQSYYAHYARFLGEMIRLPFMSAKRRKAWVRLENVDVLLRAHAKGKGILLLTGHVGNFEVSGLAGITQFPQYRGLFHFVRRPLKPRLLNEFVMRRFRRAGFGVLGKRGSLDRIIELLRDGAFIVYVFDQHAVKGEGITVDFFGHPAGTFKSVALLALETGAPVIPAYTWRERDGSHVVRFEEEVPLVTCEDAGEAIRLNTRAYNAAIERMILAHPEQWIWMHRRWKV
jgi:KDO2-lipid IV(A) lauroyltransferase